MVRSRWCGWWISPFSASFCVLAAPPLGTAGVASSNGVCRALMKNLVLNAENLDCLASPTIRRFMARSVRRPLLRCGFPSATPHDRACARACVIWRRPHQRGLVLPLCCGRTCFYGAARGGHGTVFAETILSFWFDSGGANLRGMTLTVSAPAKMKQDLNGIRRLQMGSGAKLREGAGHRASKKLARRLSMGKLRQLRRTKRQAGGDDGSGVATYRHRLLFQRRNGGAKLRWRQTVTRHGGGGFGRERWCLCDKRAG